MIDKTWDGTRKTYEITRTVIIHPYDEWHCQGCEFYNFNNTMGYQKERCDLFNVNWLPIDKTDPQRRALRLAECLKLSVRQKDIVE